MEALPPPPPLPSPTYTKLINSALAAGLLSPPPAPSLLRTRSNPTLYDIMCNDQLVHHTKTKKTTTATVTFRGSVTVCSPGRPAFDDPDTADVRLTVGSGDVGPTLVLGLHRAVLCEHSRFFANKVPVGPTNGRPFAVEVAHCDDMEAYVETLRMMYCGDLRRRLLKEDVAKVLAILKVSAAISFDAGVLACLEYLEAAPWAEDEEEKVALVVSQLRLDGSGPGEVLKRVSTDTNDVATDDEGVILRLLRTVLEAKDEKARREMKALLSKMLRENTSNSDPSKEAVYIVVEESFKLLKIQFVRAVSDVDFDASQIARLADNLHWLLGVLVDRLAADQFAQRWAGETELAAMHGKVRTVHRHEVSRVTAGLFVGIGKARIMATRETRCLLVKNWLGPFYEDFGWIRRGRGGLDRHVVEEGLASTVLTLPMEMQQEVLLGWFDRFVSYGDECPNIRRGFEVWWRRAFWRRNQGEEDAGRPQLQRRIAAICEHS